MYILYISIVFLILLILGLRWPIIYLALLSGFFVVFGLLKFQGQFQLTNEELSKLTLLDLKGQQLVFRFASFSKFYECILGLFQVLSGVLIIWKRTRFLGLLIYLPIIGNIFLINIGFNFGYPITICTGTMVLMNFILLSKEAGFKLLLNSFKKT